MTCIASQLHWNSYPLTEIASAATPKKKYPPGVMKRSWLGNPKLNGGF